MKTSLNELVSKHIVCYSGGHSSALVAIEVVRKYGKENVVLLITTLTALLKMKTLKDLKKRLLTICIYQSLSLTTKILIQKTNSMLHLKVKVLSLGMTLYNAHSN